MARYGYIRLDNDDPDVARQAGQLDSIGNFDKIFVEQKNFTKQKPGKLPEQLTQAINTLKEGDLLYVAALDRFCSTMDEFIRLTERILSKGADFICLEDSLDTRNASGKSTLKIIKKLKTIDTETFSKRKKDGIRIAKEEGKRIGRPLVSIPAGFRQICIDWSSGKLTGIEAIRISGMKSTTFYSKAAQMGYQVRKGSNFPKN
jgi:DNA invertase Pin-like site-specific DNA recombinase